MGIRASFFFSTPVRLKASWQTLLASWQALLLLPQSRRTQLRPRHSPPTPAPPPPPAQTRPAASRWALYRAGSSSLIW